MSNKATAMSSPIFDSTFGTGRFGYEEPMTTSGKPSPEPQDVREALADLIFAAEQYLDFDGDRRAIPDLIRRAKEKGKAALAQSDAGPPPLRYSDKVERAGDGTETRRLELAQSDAEPVRYGDLIPDCPTEGVAARQGNGG